MTVETLDRTNPSRGQPARQHENQRHLSHRPHLEGLRRQVRLLERGESDEGHGVAPLGAAALDERLPGGGLATTGLHEILPARNEWDDGAEEEGQEGDEDGEDGGEEGLSGAPPLCGGMEWGEEEGSPPPGQG